MGRSLEEIKKNLSHEINPGDIRMMYHFDNDTNIEVAQLCGDTSDFTNKELNEALEGMAKCIYDNTAKARKHIGLEMTPDSFYAMYDETVLYAAHGSSFDIKDMRARQDNIRDLYAAMVGTDAAIKVYDEFEKYDVKNFDVSRYVEDAETKSRPLPNMDMGSEDFDNQYE